MLLASCSPHNSLHCPKVKAQNAQYNYTNKLAMMKLSHKYIKLYNFKSIKSKSHKYTILILY